ncbi:MAG TPA: IS1380 family transposase [Solirubrobacterales bacterium]|nr:IS1380 family transposase [Solirubrobacterales bacterium]
MERLIEAAAALDQEVTHMVNDSAAVVFDDERAVANAGVVLPATLAARLGLEALVEECVDLGERPGAANPGRKTMTLVAAMTLGGDCIEDCEVLRSGRTAAVLPHGVVAPSTLGTFLRSFTFGHVRQLDRVLGEALTRAWKAGAGPGKERLVIDVDSFVGEVHGYAKQGASYGYDGRRGYHPLLATRADTGEVLHIRTRKGSANTSRGMLRFLDELFARVGRAGAEGPKLLRADSGFWSNKAMERLDEAGWRYSIGVRMQRHVTAAIEEIGEEEWTPLADYPAGGEAQIAETTLGERRLIVRRTRLTGEQAELFPDWRHFAFLTNRTETLGAVEAEHRAHAVVELAIRDLKDQALRHFPSGKFNANAAWAAIAALAPNQMRWTGLLGLPGATVRTARTLRRRLLALPGRLTRSARRRTLHLPARWPWRAAFVEALERIRALPTAA